MVRQAILAFIPAFLSLCTPGLASANIIWRGDFETGDFSQWSKAQLTSSDRAQIVTSPVGQGRYALRVMVHQGDNPIGASGNRNELVYLSYESRGTERFYRWQTMWDPSYPSANTWQLFTQWHHSGSDGSPPLEFYVLGENIELRANASTVLWTAPLVRGKWHDFILHIKWSPDPSEGFVEIWYDGQLALPKRAVANQFPGQTNYLKQGLYRNDTISEDGIVYHDGFVIGETLQDVQDAYAAQVSSPDAGQALADSGIAPGSDADSRFEDGGGSGSSDRDSGSSNGQNQTTTETDGGISNTTKTPPGCGGTIASMLSPMLLGLTAIRRNKKWRRI